MRPELWKFVAGHPVRRLVYFLALVGLVLALIAGLLFTVGRRGFGGSETIGFFRTDVAREVNTPFIVNRDGSHETQLGHDVGVLSPDGSKLLTVSEGNWARPAVSNADGSDLNVLEAYPGLEMQLRPIAWSPDGSRILVATGGPDVTPTGKWAAHGALERRRRSGSARCHSRRRRR